jgi:nicotinamidase-related amidase
MTISPQNSALVIIDMQNFFLSSALGHSEGEGIKAEQALLAFAIPKQGYKLFGSHGALLMTI